MKISKLFNFLIIGYFLWIILFTYMGFIRFGNGLGDIFYIMFLIPLVIVNILSNIFITRKKSMFIMSIIFFVIALVVTYEFTFGRGVEDSWNGKILYNIRLSKY